MSINISCLTFFLSHSMMMVGSWDFLLRLKDSIETRTPRHSSIYLHRNMLRLGKDGGSLIPSQISNLHQTQRV